MIARMGFPWAICQASSFIVCVILLLVSPVLLKDIRGKFVTSFFLSLESFFIGDVTSIIISGERGGEIFKNQQITLFLSITHVWAK